MKVEIETLPSLLLHLSNNEAWNLLILLEGIDVGGITSGLETFRSELVNELEGLLR